MRLLYQTIIDILSICNDANGLRVWKSPKGLNAPTQLCRAGCNQPQPFAPLCDIPSGCCFCTGPWTVTRSSLRMLHLVAAFCRPLRPVLLLAPFPCSRSPVVGVPGLF